jgi:alpha-D-ribose 1-methylphosphonate 5-triphosphate synthase subunit PhnH
MTALAAAFSNPVFAAQTTFRRILDAFARPGTIYALPETVSAPRPLSRGAAAVALTLFDLDTPIWLDAAAAAEPEVASWLRFHTGAPIASDPAHGAFALVCDPERAPPFDIFAVGTPEYPDRSTMLILQVDSFDDGRALTLAGPGIKDRNTFRATPLPRDLPQQLTANRALFPRGVDLLLISGTAVAAMPRSVRLIDEA